MKRRVDINVDIGEGFPYDEDLLDFATSANVCCGEHAGSWELTKDTIFLCERKGVRLGVHPGFPDRENMGRVAPQENEVVQYANSIFEQVIRFREYTSIAQYLKPHGAWYLVLTEAAPSDPPISRACKLMLDGALAAAAVPVMLLAKAPVLNALEEWRVIAEGFADRGYAATGSLVPRSNPYSLLTEPDEIASQVLKLAPEVDSICIHGDTPSCVEIAELVYRTLEDAGFEVGF